MDTPPTCTPHPRYWCVNKLALRVTKYLNQLYVSIACPPENKVITRKHWLLLGPSFRFYAICFKRMQLLNGPNKEYCRLRLFKPLTKRGNIPVNGRSLVSTFVGLCMHRRRMDSQSWFFPVPSLTRRPRSSFFYKSFCTRACWAKWCF